MSDEFTYQSATQLVALLARRRIGAVELTRAFLERIERLDGRLNSYITVTADAALREARRLDRARGRRASLHGLPVAVKDLFATKGLRTTAGSKILADWVPSFDATVVERLRAAGAVLLGKLNLHEFAYGSTTKNPHYGPTHNPWDLERVPGGSSGGSGAGVASGLCAAALGTDTGGSIRIPAAACGVVGLKPTYARVSRHGVVPLSWSLDHVGPLTRTVEDAALLLTALAGADARDPTCSKRRVDNYRVALRHAARGLKVGVPREHFFDLLAAPVRAAFDDALATLKRLGIRIQSVSIPSLPQSQAAELAIMMPEASAYHALNLRTRAADYGADVRAALEAGRFVPATTMVAAQRLRARLAEECAQAFERVDALIVPSLPVAAPRISDDIVQVGEVAVDVATALSRNMMPFNLTGLPVVSVPCGRSPEGMPIGVQLAGRPFDEGTVLRIAHDYEQATAWHAQHPALDE
jgi:aspartyl-tRNA(Asn)/glutamyl-tRNA(Gln) amidotransferase subunit A